VKKRRNNEMLKVQNEISEEDNAEFIGRQVEVLVEGPSKSAQKVGQDSSGALAEQLVGRSNCDRIVVFDGNPRLAGTIARIEIIDVTPTTLIGSIVTKEYQLHSGPSLPILQ
jgi:tRNA-2-methylthio-N6-dimethylallyladenosine synthase